MTTCTRLAIPRPGISAVDNHLRDAMLRKICGDVHRTWHNVSTGKHVTYTECRVCVRENVLIDQDFLDKFGSCLGQAPTSEEQEALLGRTAIRATMFVADGDIQIHLEF